MTLTEFCNELKSFCAYLLQAAKFFILTVTVNIKESIQLKNTLFRHILYVKRKGQQRVIKSEQHV